MKPSTRRAGLAAIALVAVLAVYLALPSAPVEPAPRARRDAGSRVDAPPVRLDPGSQRSASGARAAAAIAPLRTGAGPAAVQLPDAALPFARQVEALSALALAGHATAACRLLAGASKCIAAASTRAFSRQLERSLVDADPRASDELMVRAIAAADAGDAGGECGDLDAAQVPPPDRYLPAAAAAMSTRQRVLLAMMRADGSLVRLPRVPDTQVRMGRNSDLLIAQFIADNALRFLEEGVARADPLALEGLILVHAPGSLPGSINGMALALPDPRRFARYALLMQRVYGEQVLGPAVSGMLARTLATLPAQQRAQLQAEADRRASQWRALPPAPALHLDGPPVGDALSLCATD